METLAGDFNSNLPVDFSVSLLARRQVTFNSPFIGGPFRERLVAH